VWCGVAPAAKGTAAATQVDHDCKVNVCDGSGAASSAPDVSDVPEPDGTGCTIKSCNAGGFPVTKSVEPGVSCGADGTGVCTGNGLCGVCVPQDTRCTGNTREVCTSKGTWSPADCSSTTPICSAGACVGVTQLAAGGAHTCALLSNGHVRCWGSSDKGQLGTMKSGPGTKENAPVELPSLTNATQLALGGSHSCAVLADTTMACWGDNASGQLGLGPGGSSVQASPSPVATLQGVKKISLGGAFTCAVREDGSLYCWGANDHGQLGVVTPGMQVAPKQVETLVGVSQLACGGSHACAAIANGATVSCWGSDSDGQLGNGDSSAEDKKIPVGIPSFGPVQILGAGGLHSCAVENGNSGQVKCWGDDTENPLGFASGGFGKKSQSSPLGGKISVGPAQVALGGQHTCVLAMSLIQCSGNNADGQLGTGKIGILGLPGVPQSPTPVYREGVTVLVDVVEIAAGGNHTCARQSTGEVLCWGRNAEGQLGVGTSDLALAYPKQVKR
jgi:alpha-tubulin suppressor-like RCC1 family protein